MPLTRYEFTSLVEPPEGYELVSAEIVVLTDKPHFYFRGKVRRPDGSFCYTATWLESKAKACEITFWQDFWRQVDDNTRRRREGSN